MSQEGHTKDLECILGDSRILAEQLLWSVIPRCVASVVMLLGRKMRPNENSTAAATQWVGSAALCK